VSPQKAPIENGYVVPGGQGMRFKLRGGEKASGGSLQVPRRDDEIYPGIEACWFGVPPQDLLVEAGDDGRYGGAVGAIGQEALEFPGGDEPLDSQCEPRLTDQTSPASKASPFTPPLQAGMREKTTEPLQGVGLHGQKLLRVEEALGDGL